MKTFRKNVADLLDDQNLIEAVYADWRKNKAVLYIANKHKISRYAVIRLVEYYLHTSKDPNLPKLPKILGELPEYVDWFDRPSFDTIISICSLPLDSYFVLNPEWYESNKEDWLRQIDVEGINLMLSKDVPKDKFGSIHKP